MPQHDTDSRFVVQLHCNERGEPFQVAVTVLDHEADPVYIHVLPVGPFDSWWELAESAMNRLGPLYGVQLRMFELDITGPPATT